MFFPHDKRAIFLLLFMLEELESWTYESLLGKTYVQNKITKIHYYNYLLFTIVEY